MPDHSDTDRRESRDFCVQDNSSENARSPSHTSPVPRQIVLFYDTTNRIHYMPPDAQERGAVQF